MADITINTDCLQYVTIPPGGTAAIPNAGQVVYFDENAILTSECESVQAQIDDTDTSTGCYGLAWQVEFDTGGGTGPWNVNEVLVSKIGLGGTEYAVSIPALNSPTNQQILVSKIKEKFPFIDVEFEDLGQTGERVTFRLNLTIPTVFGTQFFLEFKTTAVPGFTPSKFYAESCADCCSDDE